jgi:hypothetical protein
MYRASLYSFCHENFLGISAAPCLIYFGTDSPVTIAMAMPIMSSWGESAKLTR